MNNSKYIFFDIDGTLTEGNFSSWDYITIGLGLDLKVHHNILKKLKENQITLQNAINALSLYWKSSNKANKKEFLTILNSIKLRKNSENTIQELKNNGYKIILLTGSLDIFAKLLSEKLYTDDFLTTSFIIWEDEKLKSFHYELDQCKSKLNQMKQYIKINNIQKENCIMVGNGNNDIDVFKYLNLSFCLKDTSDEETKIHATYVISNLNELLNYLE